MNRNGEPFQGQFITTLSTYQHIVCGMIGHTPQSLYCQEQLPRIPICTLDADLELHLPLKIGDFAMKEDTVRLPTCSNLPRFLIPFRGRPVALRASPFVLCKRQQEDDPNLCLPASLLRHHGNR